MFIVKRLISRALDKLKARLIIRGFSQKFKINFIETFALTIRYETLRTFIVVVYKEDLELHLMDVNSTFTNSYL